MERTISIVNTVAASAADILVAAGLVTIQESGANITPSMRYLIMSDISAEKLAAAAGRGASRVTFAVANSTEYSFNVSQVVGGIGVNKTASFVSQAASATAAQIGQGLADDFNLSTDGRGLSKVESEAFYTASDLFLDIVAPASDPVQTVSGISNVTVTAANSASKSVVANQVYLSTVLGNISGTTTVSIAATGHNLVEDQRINITITGGGGTLDGGATVTDVRINITDANNFTLEGTVGASLTGATAYTVTVIEQESRGTQTDVQADLDAALVGSTTGLASSASYSRWDFDWSADAPAFMKQPRSVNDQVLTLYVNDTDADFSDFADRIQEIRQGFAAGTTVCDPALIAKA